MCSNTLNGELEIPSQDFQMVILSILLFVYSCLYLNYYSNFVIEGQIIIEMIRILFIDECAKTIKNASYLNDIYLFE